jgi:predicted peroxiredoxin
MNIFDLTRTPGHGTTCSQPAREETGMKERNRNEEGMDRAEFLKTVGLAGLGMAGLSALAGGTPALADAEKKGKYVFVISHGGNDPNRAVFGLLMAATVAEKGWGSVHVWTVLEGAELAHKEKLPKIESPIYKKFGTARELVEKLKNLGATFGVCPPCADYFGATGDAKVDLFERAGGDWLMKNIQDSWVTWA